MRVRGALEGLVARVAVAVGGSGCGGCQQMVGGGTK